MLPKILDLVNRRKNFATGTAPLAVVGHVVKRRDAATG